MELRVYRSLLEIPPTDWNALAGTSNPFLRHEFLAALEETGCVSAQTGWLPVHLTLWEQNELVAAAPAYLKGHSWGEFVFDFAWANAYARHGLEYYPKLIIAAPFSPVTGPRLLLRRESDRAGATTMLSAAAQRLCRDNGWSSAHWLFTDEADCNLIERSGFALRLGYQFHWHDAGFGDFEGFLGALSSKKRKNIRQERKQVGSAGAQFRHLFGSEISAEDWRSFFEFYQQTFYAHGNIPPLNLEFFQRIGATLEDAVMLVQARRQGDCVAAALFLRGPDTLYGRYWGSAEHYAGLHFETCYYQGIEHCLSNGLTRFEPGAQGEHKLARGFLPRLTRSMHWLQDPGFAEAVTAALQRERIYIEQEVASYMQRSPFRGA